MSGDKTAVTAHLDDSELRRLERFKSGNGHGNPSNAARKAINRGIRDWEREADPAQSWILNIGLAAMLWAIMAVVGSIAVATPPWDIAAFSVVMAFVFLTAHAVQLYRQRRTAAVGQPEGVGQ